MVQGLKIIDIILSVSRVSGLLKKLEAELLLFFVCKNLHDIYGLFTYRYLIIVNNYMLILDIC